jgi:hypothetical protein
MASQGVGTYPRLPSATATRLIEPCNAVRIDAAARYLSVRLFKETNSLSSVLCSANYSLDAPSFQPKLLRRNIAITNTSIPMTMETTTNHFLRKVPHTRHRTANRRRVQWWQVGHDTIVRRSIYAHAYLSVIYSVSLRLSECRHRG